MKSKYFCSSCAKIDKHGKKIDHASGRITYQCICYGKPRTFTARSENELTLQGCGDW